MAGNAKFEQSDLVEVLLTVTEAAVDYFNPPQQKPNEVDPKGPPVNQTKVDRIRGIIYSFVSGGEKVRTGGKTFRMVANGGFSFMLYFLLSTLMCCVDV